MAALSAAIILVAALQVAWQATTVRLPLLGMPLEEYLASAPQVAKLDDAWPYRRIETHGAEELVEGAIFGPTFGPGASEGGLVLCVLMSKQAFDRPSRRGRSWSSCRRSTGFGGPVSGKTA
jgi:hypothetical protein